jgi:hypothetical protein
MRVNRSSLCTTLLILAVYIIFPSWRPGVGGTGNLGAQVQRQTYAYPVQGDTYYVALNGNDDNPGTKDKPFRNIQKCADIIVAGDTCYVREGTYRETVRPKTGGRRGTRMPVPWGSYPVRYIAYPGEVVTLSGTEPITASWTVYKGSIYQTKVDQDFTQLFVDGQMMIEARWPNMRFEELWDRSKWAKAAPGSDYGKMVDPELARTGIDWTGALATLNVAHQFLTWTRTVKGHAKGAVTFEYDRDFDPNLEGSETSHAVWENGRYYLSGKLEALDIPTEWYLDSNTHMLYLWTPDGKSPSSHKVEFKARDYIFDVQDLNEVHLIGFHMFGGTFRFENSDHSWVDHCHLMYPTYTRELTEVDHTPKDTPSTHMTGSYNRITNSSLAYSPTFGFRMIGSYNVAENNLIHDVCWNGSIRYPAIEMFKKAADEERPYDPSIIRSNTIFNAGGVLVYFRWQKYIIEKNEVYDGCLASKDVALMQTGAPPIFGTIVRYNWIHGCRVEGGTGGLGVRGDDQTRGMTIHNNVIWDITGCAINPKGDYNQVFNNTTLASLADPKPGTLCIDSQAEPFKYWYLMYPMLDEQNYYSLVFNNIGVLRTGPRPSVTHPGNVFNNYSGAEVPLRDPKHFDFRPVAGSPLVDGGRTMPGLTSDYLGGAPDIGAYESGGSKWRPGYRNSIWVSGAEVYDRNGMVSREVELGGSTKVDIKVVLMMPTLKPVTVTVGPDQGSDMNVSVSELTFTPSDWMRARTVSVLLKNPLAEAGLSVEANEMAPVHIVLKH